MGVQLNLSYISYCVDTFSDTGIGTLSSQRNEYGALIIHALDFHPKIKPANVGIALMLVFFCLGPSILPHCLNVFL